MNGYFSTDIKSLTLILKRTKKKRVYDAHKMTILKYAFFLNVQKERYEKEEQILSAYANILLKKYHQIPSSSKSDCFKELVSEGLIYAKGFRFPFITAKGQILVMQHVSEEIIHSLELEIIKHE